MSEWNTITGLCSDLWNDNAVLCIKVLNFKGSQCFDLTRFTETDKTTKTKIKALRTVKTLTTFKV